MNLRVFSVLHSLRAATKRFHAWRTWRSTWGATQERSRTCASTLAARKPSATPATAPSISALTWTRSETKTPACLASQSAPEPMNPFILHPLTNYSITSDKRACITWAWLNIRPSLLQRRLRVHASAVCHLLSLSGFFCCLHAWLRQIIKWSVPLGRVTVWATTDLERRSQLRQSFACLSGPWKEKERLSQPRLPLVMSEPPHQHAHTSLYRRLHASSVPLSDY